MLHSLVELAQDRAPERRGEVMHALTHLLVAGVEQHSDRELVLFGDILCRLLDQVPLDDRIAVSDRVAPHGRTPRDLALKLATDEAVVATPVLSRSPVLSDQDLARVASTRGQDHLIAIARRASLSDVVTDILVDRGEGQTLLTLVANVGAVISPSGYGALGGKARSEAALCEALAGRIDLPPSVAREILASLEPQSRRRVEQILAMDGERLDSLLGTSLKLLEATRNDQRRNRAEVRQHAADIRADSAQLDQILLPLIAERRMVDVIALLADLAGVHESHVSNVLHKINGSGIACICRVLSVSDAAYERLSLVRCEKLRLPTTQARQMLRDYRATSMELAERTVRIHKIRSARELLSVI